MMKARRKGTTAVILSVCSQSYSQHHLSYALRVLLRAYISMLPVYSQCTSSHAFGIPSVILSVMLPVYFQNTLIRTLSRNLSILSIILSVILSVYPQSYPSILAFICRIPYLLSSSSFLPSSSFLSSFIFFHPP